jgi:RimJ/RimL family protein N-acetyltransferase
VHLLCSNPSRELSRSPSTLPSLAKLGQEDRGLILEHLLALSDDDRRLRFYSFASDDSIVRYVDAMDFANDLVMGFVEDGRLLALIHLGVLREPGAIELGISVNRDDRGRGLGLALTRQALALARSQGFQCVYVCYMDENHPMRAIVAHYPVPVAHDGHDSEVRIPLDLAA